MSENIFKQKTDETIKEKQHAEYTAFHSQGESETFPAIWLAYTWLAYKASSFLLIISY